MGDYQRSGALFAGRGITLNSLKDEMHSLNMRMLLAMQNHNEEAQEELQKEMAGVQTEIDQINLCIGRKHGTVR